MPLYLPDECPKCGVRLMLPAMSVDYIIEGLMAESGGKCPECGEQVVVDQPPQRKPRVDDLLDVAKTIDEIRAVPVVDFALSVRSRRAIFRLGVNNMGDLLDLTRQTAHERLSDQPNVLEELEQLLAKHGIHW
jgi:DNA-directed RNA polymerase subunit RPC12/RpoP